MDFVWKLPNDPPDSAAIQRMKGYFQKPQELMPVAWFISGKIDYYENLGTKAPAKVDSRELGEALHEIAGGIIAFPEVHFVTVWRDWFKFLLPYAIEKADEPGSYIGQVYQDIMVATVAVYPDNIIEEYPGFRNDLVGTVGTRV